MIEFHPVQLAQAEDLLDLSGELYASDGSPFHRERSRGALHALLSEPHLGHAAWIVADGERAGYIVLGWGFSLEFGGRNGFVDELFVREPFRGLGLGSAALAWAEDVARAEGIGALHLEVEFSNERAQALYRRRGFGDHSRFLWTKWL